MPGEQLKLVSSEVQQEDTVTAELDNPNRLVAFGGYVKEHQYDPEGELAKIELTQAEKDWFTADKLTEILFQDERGRGLDTNPVGYAKGVLLPPSEYTWVKRPPELLARSAARRTLNATTEIDDEAQARSQRSMVHALETTTESIEARKEGLIERRQDILTLRKEARTPGWAHKPAHEMQRLIGQAWSEMLNMLDTLKIYREWDDQTRLRAESAAVRYLTSEGQNTRVGHWQSLLRLEDNYLQARVGLLGQSERDHRHELDEAINQTTDSTSKLEE
ncbi:MAG: hypothetical protein U5L95_04645 [Candidatus Saccharibacteria bacterium]|nr:hypothetical protein [Candidatus Saccharibacteria bacterium]